MRGDAAKEKCPEIILVKGMGNKKVPFFVKIGKPNDKTAIDPIETVSSLLAFSHIHVRKKIYITISKTFLNNLFAL